MCVQNHVTVSCLHTVETEKKPEQEVIWMMAVNTYQMFQFSELVGYLSQTLVNYLILVPFILCDYNYIIFLFTFFLPKPLKRPSLLSFKFF